MRRVANAVLVVGVLALVQGAVGFFLRFNLLAWSPYGPGLAPVNFVGVGIGICVVAFALRTLVGMKARPKAAGDDAE
jgi:hypothetical protein